MKKTISLWLLIVSLVFIAWCGNQQEKVNKQAENLVKNENVALVNVDEKVKQAEQTLKKIWLTWDKIKDELAKQKDWFEIISKLKWDARKKYVLEKQVLPAIIKSWKINSKCTTTNLNNYISCLYVTKTPIKKLLDEVPSQFQDIIKKQYYQKVYSLNKQELFKKTNDKVAIEEKKKAIIKLRNIWLLSNSTICNKFPEKEVKDYCLSLFGK